MSEALAVLDEIASTRGAIAILHDDLAKNRQAAWQRLAELNALEVTLDGADRREIAAQAEAVFAELSR